MKTISSYKDWRNRSGFANSLKISGLITMPVCLLLLFLQVGFTNKAANPGKEIVLRLEPGPDNPRNSEGDFINLKSGRILFIYSRYFGSQGGDHSPAYLASRFSDDGGSTWSSEDVKVVEREGTMNVMSVSLLRLKNGKIALFYLKKNSETDCIPMVRFSSDEAKTWSEPVACITDKQGYFVLNNNRVIQLSNGRLLMAVNLYNIAEGSGLNKGSLWSYYSDDNGLTWKSGVEVPNPEKFLTQEPGIVELKNKDVLMIIRSDAGAQCISYSKDKGVTWSSVKPSNIKSPVSPASIERIPTTGDLLLVWNNNGGDDPAIKGKRTPLTVAISRDEGKTWQNVKNVESDPDGWYCYIAIHFTGKDVLLGHCAGNRPKGTGLAVTQITKLNLDWIYN
ncbi:sialidase family protein [Daejeonella sp. JGW-45]|uniref:sialidase family protein n=1 Tax=Daejeonella sp. JGW-45 TaxID=3034148 RepID=UPI0023ED6EAD|nr:sialidase family protein [Daejeonella sp. JGW-45]